MAKKNKVQQQEDLLEIEMSLVDKYKKPFTYGCVALVVIVAAVSLWQWKSAELNQKAQEELFTSETYFRAGQYEQALNGDSLGNKGFVEMSNGSTKAANLATLYAGLSYAKLGNWEEAIKYLEDFDTKGDQTVSVNALRTLANCYANVENIDKAVSTFKKAAKMANGNTLETVCLMEAAQLLEVKGEKQEARSIYENIKKEHPQMGAQVDKYLLRLGE